MNQLKDFWSCRETTLSAKLALLGAPASHRVISYSLSTSSQAEYFISSPVLPFTFTDAFLCIQETQTSEAAPLRLLYLNSSYHVCLQIPIPS